MKIFKLTLVAILVSFSMLVIASPPSKVNVLKEAKQELYKDVKSKLVKWYAMGSHEGFSEEVFVVYCIVDTQNELKITRVIGSQKELKEGILKTMENHPIQANKVLQGEYLAFKLRFEHYEN